MQKKIWTLFFCLFVVALLLIGVAFATTKMIKAEDGGVIKIRNGAEFVIPPEALEEDTKISAVMSSRQITDEKGLGRKLLVFTFGPFGTTFDPPAELHIDKGLLEEEDIDDIEIYNEDGEEIEAEFDEDANELILYIPDFSYYYYERR